MVKSNNIYIRKKRKKRLIKRCILLLILLLGIGTFVAYKTEFFIVDKIVYKGDSLITGEFIKTNVEEAKGSNIIVFNKDELIKKLMQNPYVATVTISKKLPKTLEVNVDEKKGIYYEKNGNSFDIISEDLHLLERTNSLEGKNLIEIKGLNTKDKEVGMKIEENKRLEKVLNLLYKAEEKMQKDNKGVSITSLDVNDMSNMKIYFGNIQVLLGNDENLTKKLSDAMNIYIHAKPKEYIKVSHEGSPDYKIRRSKMKKQTSQIFVAVVCALLGFLLAYQFKMLAKKDGTDGNINNTDIISEVESLKKEKEELSATNSKLTEEIKKLEESATESGKVDLEVKKALDNARIQLGTVDVKGPGIIVTIKPKTPIFSNAADTSVDLGSAELVHLVNTLWYAGAEAISINDYRVTAQTGIMNSSGTSIIWIGTSGRKVSPKETIVIKAIGDKTKLNVALDFPGALKFGALDNYDVTYKGVDDIFIEKTTESYRTDFITPVKE